MSSSTRGRLGEPPLRVRWNIAVLFLFSILSRLPWEHKSAQAEVYKAAGAVLYYSKTQKEGILWTKLPSGGRSVPKSRP